MSKPVVLVVRGDDGFSEMLRNGGCEVLNLELIRTVPAADLFELDRILMRINEYDGLFFTSPAAAEIFVKRSKKAIQNFGGKIYVLGERAKTILENAGFEIVYREDANTAGDLIESFDEIGFAGKKLLFVRGDKSRRTIPNLLSDKAIVDEIVVYETREIQPDEKILHDVERRLRSGGINWICFFSPSGVQSFSGLFRPELFESVNVAAIGETTASEARESKMNVEFTSTRANAEDFAVGLAEHFKNSE